MDNNNNMEKKMKACSKMSPMYVSNLFIFGSESSQIGDSFFRK